MQLSQWFYQQIRASTEGFCWAVEQIPQERYYLSPKPGKWSVGRIIYHMVCYDQLIGRPTLPRFDSCKSQRWVARAFCFHFCLKLWLDSDAILMV
jgi:uncharacterized damage-inducible protein DinB